MRQTPLAPPLFFFFLFVVFAAFVSYEELTDSKAQLRSLTQIITALHASTVLDKDEYDNLCSRSTQFSIKLLKKPDQVRSILLCARLFWREGRNEGPHEVLTCLQRALKVADQCIPSTPSLFVEIFSSYTYFFDKKCPSVEAIFINELVALCNDQVEAMKTGADKEEAVRHLRNNISHIKEKKASADTASHYAAITAVN